MKPSNIHWNLKDITLIHSKKNDMIWPIFGIMFYDDELSIYYRVN